MVSAETWSLAISTAFSGITGVFVVMLFLQVSIRISTKIIKAIEKPKESDSHRQQQLG